MRTTQSTMKNNPFTFLLLLFVVIGGFVILFIQKGDFVLFLNNHRSEFMNTIMKYGTHLGDGLALLPLLLISLFFSYSHGIRLVGTSLFVLLFSQGLKRWVFFDYARPTAYFDHDIMWNFVEGVKVAKKYSFPSGHTITSFAVFFFLALLINKRWFYVLAFFLALFTGITRNYLLQHFFIDIYFGSMLGFLAVWLGITVTDRIIGTNRIQKLETKSLRSLF